MAKQNTIEKARDRVVEAALAWQAYAKSHSVDYFYRDELRELFYSVHELNALTAQAKEGGDA